MKKRSNNNLLISYLGFGVQLAVMLAILVWAGIFVDDKLENNFPLFTILLPLTGIIGMIIKVIRDTNRKNK